MIDRLSFRLLFAQVADVVTFLAFYLLIGAGVHEERNPLIVLVMLMVGLAGVAVFKIGVTLIVVWRGRRAPGLSRFRVLRRFAAHYPRFQPRLRVILASAATASGITGAGFNTAAIIHGLR